MKRQTNVVNDLWRLFYMLKGKGHSTRRYPYTGEQLRAIRAENGVGRPPHITLEKRYIKLRKAEA